MEAFLKRSSTKSERSLSLSLRVGVGGWMNWSFKGLPPSRACLGLKFLAQSQGYVTLIRKCTLNRGGGCSSAGRAGWLVIVGSNPSSPGAELSCMSKCPWARSWTPTSWCAINTWHGSPCQQWRQWRPSSCDELATCPGEHPALAQTAGTGSSNCWCRNSTFIFHD